MGSPMGFGQIVAGVMKRLVIACCLLIVCFDAAEAEIRVALVIGNSSYKFARLKNPRSDAALLSRTLASVGFDVMTLMDASAADMRAAMAEFGRRLQAPDAVALFYYAGHGLQAGGDNYLVPVSQSVGTSVDVARDAVALRELFKTLEHTQSHLNIVILDACRNTPFAEGAATLSAQGLAPVVAPAGTLIGYATAPGQIALDGDGANSPYTEALSSSIPIPGATLEDVFRATRRRVLAVTSGKQTPWEHSSLTSEFYFKPKSADVESNAVPASDVPALQVSEITDWERIKASHDPDDFKAHLEKYPSGLFAELAAVKIERLAAMRAATPWNWIMSGGGMGDASNNGAIADFESAVRLDAAATSSKDAAAAVSFYRKAADQGLAAAQYALGRSYDHGRGLEKNPAEAARWYARAAEQEHAGAMSALAVLYEFGEGIPANLAEALRLYRLAADAGDANGLAGLAYLYSEGKGVRLDTVEARRLYQMAADKGLPRASFNLALMLLKGQGGPQDLVAAVKYLQGAADRGHAGSLQQLAYLYDEGRGVARNPKLAASYLLRSVKATKVEGHGDIPMPRGWSFATRREVQRQLAERGLYRGLAHGIFNQATRQAIIASVDQ